MNARIKVPTSLNYDKKSTIKPSGLTDEELAQLAGLGEIEAEDELVRKYSDLAAIIARSFPIAGCDYDDVASEAICSIMSAARSWRPEGGAKFSTWLRRIINRSLVDMYRMACRKKEVPHKMLLSLDAPYEEDGEQILLHEAISDGNPFEEGVFDEVISSDLVETWLGTQRQILCMVSAGFSTYEVSSVLQIPVSAIHKFLGIVREFALLTDNLPEQVADDPNSYVRSMTRHGVNGKKELAVGR